MRLDPSEARRRLEAATVARLATITPEGRPHLVPVCFAVTAETIYSAVDAKPKATPALRRLANVAAHRAVSLLVDEYRDDWDALWWARADGDARVVGDGAERERAVAALRAKYPQYGQHALTDAVLAIDVRSWSGWAATPPAGTSRARGR